MVRITAYPLSQEEIIYPEAFRNKDRLSKDKRKVIFRPNCGIDGEGETRPPKHYYTKLQAVWPGGRRKLKGVDLGPHEIFDFLFHLPTGHNYVVYGASYDFNMWLRYLPADNLKQLCETNWTTWSGYKIKWVDRKYLSLTRGNRNRIIYDVIAWYQKPFVDTLKAWGVGTPEEWELIARMKEQRGNFAEVDSQEVEDYCWLECERLVELTDKLCQALQETPYRPKGLYGPGALAEAIFVHHRTKDYMGPYNEELSLAAYYGGRFDTALFGWFKGVNEYDIRSAYPDQIRYLPCLCHANWERSNNPAISRYGLYHVKWDVGIDCPYPPFPYRDSKACIWYPYSGRGWYHADEVRAAKEVFSSRIKIIDGLALIQECDHQPFAFVEQLYRWRLKLAEENYAKGQVVKLGLNSMYGKLVQSVGKPPFQNFFWGGAITAGTRAKILRVIGPKMDQIVSIATDGLITLQKLIETIKEEDISEQLGDWEYSELLEHIQISNGVYHSVKADGKPKERARGIGHGEIDWQELEAVYRERGVFGHYNYTRRSRFITIREALHLKNQQLMCTWQSEARKLEFEPTRMEVTGLNLDGEEPPYSPDQVLQFRGVRYSLADLVDMKVVPNKSTDSYPFRKKRTWEEQLELREYHRQRGQDDGDIFS